MAQWAYRGGSFVGSGDATGDDLAVAAPVGLAENDLVCIGITWADPGTLTPPAGFELVDTITTVGDFTAIYVKKAGGAEPGSYTFSAAASGQYRAAVATAYTGGTGTGTWRDVSSNADEEVTWPEPYAIPSVITTGSDRLLVSLLSIFAVSASGITVSGGVTTVRGTFSGLAWADRALAAAGASGDADWTGLGTLPAGGAGNLAALVSDITAADDGTWLPQSAVAGMRPVARVVLL